MNNAFSLYLPQYSEICSQIDIHLGAILTLLEKMFKESPIHDITPSTERKERHVNDDRDFAIKDTINELKTSFEWNLIFKVIILDPDGWDRANFNYSYNEEKISQEEFKRRARNSTCKIDPRNPVFQDLKHPHSHDGREVIRQHMIERYNK